MSSCPSSNKVRGIYIHFPFCLKKCSYCDFYSVAVSAANMMEEYVQSLVNEIKLQSPKFKDSKIETVYLGGGTPSLLGARQFSLIIDTIANYFSLTEDVEITIETNPATINESKLKSYINTGLNRISLGVQSFADHDLKILGRSHDANQVYETIDLIQKLGLENCNLDLIYGIPNQTVEDWLKNLEIAISLAPQHISMYLLQLSSETPLATLVLNNEITLLEDEMELIMYNEGINYLKANLYDHYEISNFSKQNYQCQHNMIYWKAKEYLGLGPGAVSFIGNMRCINKPQIVDYINCLALKKYPPSEVLEEMNDRQIMEDSIILGLRLTEGIEIEEFNKKFNTDLLLEYKAPIEDGISKSLLKIEKGHLKLTTKGYFLSNQVLCQFIGD
ncbi:MAG: radical SAM family heme chaperone HemW [Syntrophomonadaceae bacterium]|nr:radical SAM family heme chaperone HemW [Syntrophomonadaceae bacterium]